MTAGSRLSGLCQIAKVRLAAGLLRAQGLRAGHDAGAASGRPGSGRPAEQTPAVEDKSQQFALWLGIAGLRHCSPPIRAEVAVGDQDITPSGRNFPRRVI